MFGILIWCEVWWLQKTQLTLGSNGNDSHLVADSIAAQTQVTLFLRIYFEVHCMFSKECLIMNLQPVKKYCDTFLAFSIFSLHFMWNRQIIITRSSDLRLRIIGNEEIFGKPQAWVQACENLAIALEDWKKKQKKNSY